MEPTPTRPTVFISYSRKDKKWLEDLNTMLAPVVRTGIASVWWDGKIRPSQVWRQEIDNAMASAQVGVLLVSPNFLASDFIQNEELPYLLDAARHRGVTLLWCLVEPCLYELSAFQEIQAAHDVSRPLKKLRGANRQEALVGICREIVKAAKSLDASPLSREEGGRWERGPGGEGLEGAPKLTKHFRGRQNEVKACLKAMRSSRLVSVVGLPGIGKTELTLASAQKAMADPKLRLQRALWFSLAGMRSVEELGNPLALAFQVSKYKKIEDLARSIGRQRVLLVLDNAEDLITPSVISRLDFQAFCSIFLRSCPEVQFLLSTRRALGHVEGCEEIPVSVGRLQPPDDLKVFQSAATRLKPAEKESDDLKDLVRILEGHPLSLTLVAGQVGQGMSLSTLRRRLERDGEAAVVAQELLGGTESDWTEDDGFRTKRLVSSLNLSFGPLVSKHPEAAEIFIWLGLFPAGLLAPLVSLLFGDRGEEQVAILSGHNLVERIDSPERLVLPAPVRWYAKREMARIPEERQQALLTATFRAFGLLLNAAYERAGTEQASLSFGLALREEPNLASLLTMQVVSESPARPELAEAIARTLAPWLQLMSLVGRPSAALGLGEQAAEIIANSAPGTWAQAAILEALGDLYLQITRLREAEENYQRALPIYQQIEARIDEANTLWALGNLYLSTDQLREAEECYQSALLIYQPKDRLGKANTLQGLGRLASARGEIPRAFNFFLDALQIQPSIFDFLGEAGSCGYLARIAWKAGLLERAVVLGGRAWQKFGNVQSVWGQFLASANLSEYFEALDDEEGRRSSVTLFWHLARSIEHPSAEQIRDLLRQRLPDLNPETEPVESWLPEVEATLARVLDRYEQVLAARGEDPLSPLEPRAEEGSQAP